MTLNVEDGETLYIYHSDDVDPNETKLKDKKQSKLKKGVGDIDFRWYYSLVEPRGDSFDKWAEGGLPVPEYDPSDGPKMESPSVSTCFPAYI